MKRPSILYYFSAMAAAFMTAVLLLCEIGIWYYKTLIYPYDGSRALWEFTILSAAMKIEMFRTFLGLAGNRLGNGVLIIINLALLVVVVLFAFWLLMWQLYTIGLEVYLVCLKFGFEALAVFFGLHEIITLGR
ncbi:unnamed protein product [Calicophoron daubneyi]|uniref:ATP synthase F0 subunit 6 n=1 Tax=Calicophoron daubneyi TaxID=300641 RepID=A0AAV2T1Q5_CALDB